MLLSEVSGSLSPKADVFNSDETQLHISYSILRSTFITLVVWGFSFKENRYISVTVFRRGNLKQKVVIQKMCPVVSYCRLHSL